MKNMKYVVLMLAAAMSAAACAKVSEKEGTASVQGERLIINAVAEGIGTPDTKAHGSYGYEVLWDENDKIAVTDGTNQSSFKLVEGAGETLGKFQQEDALYLSGEVTGYYPASILQADGSVVWPSRQYYSEVMTGIPMSAKATFSTAGTNFNFKSLGGVLQLALTSAEGELAMKSITVSAQGLDPIVLGCERLVIGAASKTVNIAVPAAVYTGMQLTFETIDGSVKTMTSSRLEIKRAVVSKVALALRGFKRGDHPDYLSFTAVGSRCDIEMARNGFPDTIDFEFALSPTAENWMSFTADQFLDGNQTIVPIEAGQTIFFRVMKPRASLSREEGSWRFVFTTESSDGRVVAGGNVMSLLDPAVQATTAGDYAFMDLFKDATALISAPSLPATKIGAHCYEHMFSGCKNLTEAPELPAFALKEHCYYGMFAGSGLKASAYMAGNSLANFCCSEMYMDCQGLETARPLPATTAALQCYSAMFKECSSLRKAPELPATALSQSCYLEMFDNCTSLVEAPALPATELAVSCYARMFHGCQSLVDAPYLPASNLSDVCYYNMFLGCSSLRSISVNFTEWSDRGAATLEWVYGLPSSGTFYCPAGLSDSIHDASHIPQGWIVRRTTLPDNAPIGTILYSDGIESMYFGKAGNGRKLVISTKNLGAETVLDKGYIFDEESMNNLVYSGVFGEGWRIPTYDDMETLCRTASEIFCSEDHVTLYIGGNSYHVPYTHNVSENRREGRIWLETGGEYRFYWFRSDGYHGGTREFTATGNCVRLVREL